MNRILWSLALVLLVGNMPVWGSEVLDRVLVKVDNGIITLSDLNEATAPMLSEMRSKYPADQWKEKSEEISNHVLSQMIDEYVCTRAARDLEITVSDEEIESHIENLWKKAGITSQDQFLEELRREGMTLDDLRESLKHQALTRKVLQREVYSKVRVPDVDIRKYYEENIKLYQQASQVKVAILLLEVKLKSEIAWDETGKKAREICDLLKSGLDFGKAVKQYSDGPAVDEGGDIGYIEKGKGLPEFEEVAFALKKDEISEPFRTQHGWNIIKVQDVIPEHTQSLDEVRDDIEKQQQMMRSRDAEREWLEKQRSKTYIERVQN
jgi:parvulin-like peptidyl-prolyl isomerase